MEPHPRHSRGTKLSTAFLQERMPLNHGVLLPYALGLCQAQGRTGARHHCPGILSLFEAQIEQYLVHEATTTLCLDPSWTHSPFLSAAGMAFCTWKVMPQGSFWAANLIMQQPFCLGPSVAPASLHETIQTPPSGISCLPGFGPVGLPTLFLSVLHSQAAHPKSSLLLTALCFLNCGYPNCNVLCDPLN